MSNLRYQRRMAASILKCGENRVWIDPVRLSDVSDAITRTDIRVLINAGIIQKKPERGISNGRKKAMMAQKKKGRRQGPGSRKGPKYARYPRKRRWIDIIRPIRGRLRELRDSGAIDRHTYRRYYLWAKGGVFKNVKHMESHMVSEGDITEEVLKSVAKSAIKEEKRKAVKVEGAKGKSAKNKEGRRGKSAKNKEGRRGKSAKNKEGR